MLFTRKVKKKKGLCVVASVSVCECVCTCSPVRYAVISVRPVPSFCLLHSSPQLLYAACLSPPPSIVVLLRLSLLLLCSSPGNRPEEITDELDPRRVCLCHVIGYTFFSAWDKGITLAESPWTLCQSFLKSWVGSFHQYIFKKKNLHSEANGFSGPASQPADRWFHPRSFCVDLTCSSCEFTGLLQVL